MIRYQLASVILVYSHIHFVRIFSQGGAEGKRQVDKVIDQCDSMQVWLG